MLEALIGTTTEAVFGCVLEQTDDDDKIRALLKDDPQRLTFQLALTRTYATFDKNHPQWTELLFDEHFLTHGAAPLLARLILRNNPPTSTELAHAWTDQFGTGNETRTQTIARIEPIATDFLTTFDQELRICEKSQNLFNSSVLDATADEPQQTPQSHQELTKSLQALLNQTKQEHALNQQNIQNNASNWGMQGNFYGSVTIHQNNNSSEIDNLPVNTFPNKKELIQEYADFFKYQIDRIIPEPRTNFELSISLSENHHITTREILNDVIKIRRIILRGRAGGGKSLIFRRLAIQALETINTQPKGILPVFLNLKDWKSEYSEILSHDVQSQPELAIDTLLKMSIVDLSINRMNEFAGSNHILILLDGLNELPGEPIVLRILSNLDNYIRKALNPIYVIASTRMSFNYAPDSRWAMADLNLLSINEIQKQIRNQSKATGENINDLEDHNWALLGLPYFLDYALKYNKIHLVSSAQAMGDFLKHRLQLDKTELREISTAAFEIYKAQEGVSFSLEGFIEKIGSLLVEKLKSTGILENATDDRVRFNHQLNHDYLAALYLADKPDCWNADTFDAMSFESNSFESLVMTLEQLQETNQGNRFLQSMYNWNWVATITCIAHSAYSSFRKYTVEMETVVLSVAAEKLFDPVRGTRQRSHKALSVLPNNIAQHFVNAKNLEQVIGFVNNVTSSEVWFLNWRELFVLTPSSCTCIGEEKIQLIATRSSILGWTAANTIRRFSLQESDLRQLRTIYYSFIDDTEDPNIKDSDKQNSIVRWRVVHALGVFDTSENVQLLLQALDKDVYLWTRYGAVRSLIEIAAKTNEPSLRQFIIENLINRAHSLEPKVLQEIERTIFYNAMPNTWEEDICTLLDIIQKTRTNLADREKWQDIMQEFKQFCKEVLCH